MKKLNRERPFASIHGGNVGHHYEQDGLLFDAQGNQIGAAEEPATAKQPKKGTHDEQTKRQLDS